MDSTKVHNKYYDISEDSYYSEKFVAEIPNYNDDLLYEIFSQLREEFTKSIKDADWIDAKFAKYINDNLLKVKLKIGIPHDILRNRTYINNFYNAFIFNKFSLIENVGYHWSLERKIMGDLLDDKISENDRTVAEFFSMVINEDKKNVKYLKDLNLMLVSRKIARKPYYNHKYPL